MKNIIMLSCLWAIFANEVSAQANHKNVSPIEQQVRLKRGKGYEHLIEAVYGQIVLNPQYAYIPTEYLELKNINQACPGYQYVVRDNALSRTYIITVLRLTNYQSAKIIITDPESSLRITFYYGGIAIPKESNIDPGDPLYDSGKKGFREEIIYILLIAREQMLHDLAQQ